MRSWCSAQIMSLRRLDTASQMATALRGRVVRPVHQEPSRAAQEAQAWEEEAFLLWALPHAADQKKASKQPEAMYSSKTSAGVQ